MSMGTVIGRTREAPFSRSVSQLLRRVHTPPIPEETATPRRSGSTSGDPASFHASRAAITAICAEGSMRFVSGRVNTSSGLTAIWPAKPTSRP